MTVDTTALRDRATTLAEMGRPGTAGALTAAADEIDALRTALAEVPHAELCRLLMLRDDEPCSCAKSVLQFVDEAGTVTTSHPGVSRLTIAGPHGPVLGLPRVDGVVVYVEENHLTVSYTNPT